MGLLNRLKRALGLGSDGSEPGDGSDRRTGSVRVEHEPDAGTEAAVKGTDDEPAAAGTDAAGSTGSITETPPETPEHDDVAEAAEPAEAAGPVSQTETGDADDAPEEETAAGSGPDATGDDGGGEPADDAAGTADDAAGTADDAAGTADDRPVREISGIGPAYERRLNEAGIETVGELAAADAASLAEETDVAEGRVANWIDRAREGGG